MQNVYFQNESLRRGSVEIPKTPHPLHAASSTRSTPAVASSSEVMAKKAQAHQKASVKSSLPDVRASAGVPSTSRRTVPIASKQPKPFDEGNPPPSSKEVRDSAAWASAIAPPRNKGTDGKRLKSEYLITVYCLHILLDFHILCNSLNFILVIVFIMQDV